MVPYQLALSASCRLLIRGGLAAGEGVWCCEGVEERLRGAVCEIGDKERGGSELTVSYLSCRLTLATLYLEHGKVSI